MLFFLISFAYTQNLQVKVVTKTKIDIPVLGPVEMTVNQTVAPGFLKAETKIEAKRFYASWLMDGENGEIMIDGSEKILKYNKKKEVYWLQSPLDSDTSSSITKSFSFSSSTNDEKSPTSVTRTGGSEIESVHGFRAKKWITTINFTKEEFMVFEEWFVDELPLMRLSDSLESAIKTNFNPGEDTVEIGLFDHLSSNIFIDEMDSLTTLKPIPGSVIKINFLVFEEPGNPKTTLGFEILELYAEPVDTGYFVIPETYKRVENE